MERGLLGTILLTMAAFPISALRSDQEIQEPGKAPDNPSIGEVMAAQSRNANPIISAADGEGCGAIGGGRAAGLRPTYPEVGCADTLMPPSADPAVKARLDHVQNMKDVARLAQLVKEIQQDLERSGGLTLSVDSLKKSEEMQKLSKKLHDRLKADNSAPKTALATDTARQAR